MSDPSCLFCRIVKGEIPAKLVHETPDVIAFRDINPQAPVHVLVIPRVHVESTGALTPEHETLAGKLLVAASEVARKEGLDSFRAVSNTGADAGQSVFHLHVHVLGGRSFSWPPG